MRILIVDTQPQSRQSLKALLSAWDRNAELKETANGLDALQAAKDWQPEIVVMDMGKEKMNGIEILKQMKDKWQQIKVVVLSIDAEFERDALEAGADAFVSKMATPEKLRSALCSVSQDLRMRS